MSRAVSAKNRMARWRANNPEKAKKAYRVVDYRRTYGIELAQAEHLLEKQDGRCAVCRESETATNNQGTKPRRLSLDHCHETGKVRGFLCYRCNYVLGLCKDNVSLLRELAIYVECADSGLRIRTEPRSADDLLKELMR